MTKFIFVRHGESEANQTNRIGEFTCKLSDKGVEQAHKTGIDLIDKGIYTIACSAYTRAQQTAEIIAGELGINVDHIKIIEELGERWMGKYEGQTKDHPSEWYYTAEDPEYEPLAAMYERVGKAIKKIEELSKDGLVLVVGHALSGFFLLQAAKGTRDIKDFPPASQIDNAGYIEVEN